MTKMGRLKKGDIFNRIAYELFGVKIGEDEEVVPSAGVSAKPDSKHPAPQQKFAPAAPVAEPAKPVPAVATTYIAPGTELTGTLKTDSNVEICGKFEGDIISTGTVLLRADHHGNVTAKQLELNGKSVIRQRFPFSSRPSWQVLFTASVPFVKSISDQVSASNSPIRKPE